LVNKVTKVSFFQTRFVIVHVQPRHGTPRLTFKRAEKFIKEYRLRQRDNVRLSRQAQYQRKDTNTDADVESKLAFAIRIRK